MAKQLKRAWRRVKESVMSIEKTDLEEDLQLTINKALMIKRATENIVSETKKMVSKDKNTMPLLEQWGNLLIATGNEFGQDVPYGAKLIKAGEYECNLGQSPKVLHNILTEKYILPLTIFLDGDMKNFEKALDTLEEKRLNLDISNEGGQDLEMRYRAKNKYNYQKEAVSILAHRIVDNQDKYMELLRKLVEVQRTAIQQTLTEQVD